MPRLIHRSKFSLQLFNLIPQATCEFEGELIGSATHLLGEGAYQRGEFLAR
jgi:hypothetical protein